MDVRTALPNDAALTVVAPPAPLLSPGLAAALGWLLPGLGQLYVRRPGKALLMFTAIAGLFVTGLALTDFTCVDPDAYSLEFVAHAFLGGPTAAVYWLTRDVSLAAPLPWFEVGRLYAAVAGLLNVVAICDALGHVLETNRRARVRNERRRLFLRARVAAAHLVEEAAARARAAAAAAPPEHAP